MARYDFDIGVIGGGAAGLTVSAGAARLGAKTLLVDKEESLGGDCLHFGCVPSKTLIKTAHVRHLMATAHRYGLDPPPLPPVDFTLVRARIRDVIATIQQHDSVERFTRLGVRVLRGQPEFIDEHAVRLDGRTFSARFWVIATGSSPAVPPIPGLDHTPFITNRELFYLDRLPDSMAILGAGPVAVEMAQAFRRLGTRVHVIQRSGQILSREDKDIADLIMVELAGEGVAFHLGCQVVETRSSNGRQEVVISDGAGQRQVLQVDAILVATGRAPNVQGLGLSRIGVATTTQGITVDRRLRTSHGHIFAAGDVNGAYMFTHAAGYEGGIVVTNALFRLPRQADYTLLPWCTFTHPEVASVGMNERAARAAGIEHTVWRETFTANDRAVAEGESVGTIKMILNRKERPLGIQIVGPRAGELLAEWIAIIHGRVRLSTLAGAVHPYPTLAEGNKRLASAPLSRRLFSETVRRGLRLLFGLRGEPGSEEEQPDPAPR